MKTTILILSLALQLRAQDSPKLEPAKVFSDLSTGKLDVSSIAWTNAGADPRPYAAKLEQRGDFIFYGDDGTEVLRLKRSEKGDPIHELLALLLVRTAASEWSLKDWREWGAKK